MNAYNRTTIRITIDLLLVSITLQPISHMLLCARRAFDETDTGRGGVKPLLDYRKQCTAGTRGPAVQFSSIQSDILVLRYIHGGSH